MAKEKIRAKRSSADKAINAAIAIVMAIVIAFAAVALYDKFRPRDKVSDMAEQMGMPVEQFIEEYGLGDVTGDTKFDEAYANMTIDNALKLEGMTFEDYVASSGLEGMITPDMKISELNALNEEMAAAMESAEAGMGAEGEETPAE